jgi:hypothetical protein
MIEHTIDGATYHLRPDGGLDLADAEGRRVELAPRVFFGLAVLLRWPKGECAFLNA